MVAALCYAAPALWQVASLAVPFVAAGVASAAVAASRHRRRVALIRRGDALAGLVNLMLASGFPPSAAQGALHGPHASRRDNALMLRHLDWVQATWRNRWDGATGAQAWRDTLPGCMAMLARLRRDQVERLLAHRCERRFQTAILVRYDMVQAARTAGDAQPAAVPALTVAAPRLAVRPLPCAA